MGVNNAGTATDSAMDLIRQKKQEILYKIQHGETEEKIQIGGSSFSEKEWDKLLSKVDSSLKAFQDAEKEKEKQAEEKMKKGEDSTGNIKDTYEKLSMEASRMKEKLTAETSLHEEDTETDQAE